MISKITQNDLDLHVNWLNREANGVKLVTTIGKIEIEDGVTLSGANLSGADLRGANLRGANLSGANLSGAKNTEWAEAITCITPAGTLIGWKKLARESIAKLEIPAEAKRSNSTGRKCRAEFARVLAIFNPAGEPNEIGYSQRDDDFIYRVGEIVRPDKWDENRWEECSNGIHFFLTRYEAEHY